MRDGKLKLVDNRSLELVIDIGHVDLVMSDLLAERIATLLQRVGRSGQQSSGCRRAAFSAQPRRPDRMRGDGARVKGGEIVASH